ncbi:PAS domain-containing sensor histidine kinase [Zobellia nedashkovskayae]|uniref:PAS domain-containing sensor histidine kinase n=1 Tax=Zobellia nedashkovskayae TaxID=2779510 RepID=UPI00188BB9BE|nr:PAS domain-containing sensor histidine kinase [Zobellia nedashkovskayae]
MIEYKATSPGDSEQTKSYFWLKQLPSATALLDKDFNFVDISDKWKRKLFFQDSEIIGKSIFEIFPNLSTDMRKKLKVAVQSLTDIQVIDEVQLLDGSIRKIIWHISAWKNSSQNVLGVMLSVEDITEIKRLKYDLLKVKNLLNEKGEMAKIGSWEYDVANEQLILSDVTKKLFKIQGNSKISIKNLIGFCGQKSTEDIIKNSLYSAIEKGVPWDINLPIDLGKDKKMVKTIGRPKFKNGKCKRIIGTVQIMSGDSNSLNKLEVRDEAQLTPFFINSPIAMAVIEFSTGAVLNTNLQLDKVADIKSLRTITKKNLKILQEGILKINSDESLSSETNYFSTKLYISDPTGKRRIFGLKGKLINGGTHILCSFDDVTEQLSEISKLKKVINKNESRDEKLINFTHVICHNLKGQVINYGLMLDYFDKVTNESKKLQALEVLKYSTEDLSANVNNLREMVGIRKEVKTKKERLVINDCIFKAEQNLSVELKESKTKICNEIFDSEKIKAYPGFLENLLTNCISNAIKFRKPNKPLVITISTKITKLYTILSIEDNGIGMDLNEKGDKLFKIGSSLGNDYDSRGMGLFLASYQMDIMNGKIEVESKPGEGAVFNLFFPHL